jgi:hypothetical protein
MGQPVDESPARPDRPPLRHLRAAQMRARVVRGALVRLAFGTVFLIGALAHALSPQRHDSSSVLWMTMLSLMSTINVGLGLRALARLRRPRWRHWLPAAGAWGALSIILLALLLRR